MPYIIVGAALIVIGVLWLSLYIFTSRKTTGDYGHESRKRHRSGYCAR